MIFKYWHEKVLWLYRTFLRRFFVRLRYAFRLKELWVYKYESCGECGSFYTIVGDWENEIWLKVNGKYEGCLCLDCFFALAEKKGIFINRNDIIRLWVFNPDGDSWNIIKKGQNYTDIYDVVKKLIGPITPVGDTLIDSDRYEHLKELTLVVGKLMSDIDTVASMNKDRYEFSMKRAGEFANEFLDQLGIEE